MNSKNKDQNYSDLTQYVIFLCHDSNWGDYVNYPLVRYLCKDQKEVIPYLSNDQGAPDHYYLCVGSVLSNANQKTTVWGSGFISAHEIFILDKPKQILAVRGPKSREGLIKLGIQCPKIYGDPALLISKFYQPKIKKKHKIGLLPHYIDQNSSLVEKIRNFGIPIIDICGNFYDVIDQVLSCEFILSSSLHGLILPDAYGIPSAWVKLSNKVVGGKYKFLDYFLSVERKDRKPLLIKKDVTKSQLEDAYKNYKIQIDLEKLLEVCPFNKEDK